jgi:hypothetical protein
MKKLFILAVAPFFVIAACGNLELVLPPDAVAGNGGSGGGSCECSDNGTKDGSRLKAQYLVGEDGSRVQLPAWFDAELGDTCQFQSFDNGEIRCVPSAPALNSYVDPNCTIPVLVLKTPCDVAPEYARIEKFEYGDVCFGSKLKSFSYVKFDMSHTKEGISNTFAVSDDGQCVPAGGVPIGGGWRLYGTYPLHEGAWFVKASNPSGI